jgi:hypothetical protein
MLAHIALNILSCQASSVLCERLFSASKPAADNCHTHLGSHKFEKLQVIKFAWHKHFKDLVAWNSDEIEEIILDTYHNMLASDHWEEEFDKGEDEIILDD